MAMPVTSTITQLSAEYEAARLDMTAICKTAAYPGLRIEMAEMGTVPEAYTRTVLERRFGDLLRAL